MPFQKLTLNRNPSNTRIYKDTILKAKVKVIHQNNIFAKAKAIGNRIMEGTIKTNIEVGMVVRIVLKRDQSSGVLTEGFVDRIHTKSQNHPHGIKVRLEDGQVGRVKEIVNDEF